jgi:hypothetical protein
VCQTPPNCLSADEYSAIETFIITGPDLVGKIVSLVAFGHKVVGFPVRIESSRYHRNALLFNTCFVLSADRPTAAFEPILRKLAASFSSLEAECQFISNAATKSRLHDMLPRILEGLNVRGECVLSIDAANSINLKLFPEHRPPSDVLDHQVPLLTKELDATTTGDWDLALLEVLPFIDGLRHVKRIATDAGVDVELVRTAVRQLVYYECAQLLDIFQFSATYCCTHLISRLANTPRMQRECVEYACPAVATLAVVMCIVVCSLLRSDPCTYLFPPRRLFLTTSRYVVDDDSVHAPSFAKVFSLYCALERGVCLSDFCERHALLSLGIDPARFVIFGTINGFVRRVREFPLLLAPPSDAFDAEAPSASGGGNANSIDYRADIARRLTPSSVFGETVASMLPPKFAAYVA